MKISEDNHILTVMAPKDSKMFKASNRGIGESVRHYTFTKIFDPTTGQREFYQETAHPMVQQFIDGNNGLIFTYGVTNAGKTYTLQGAPGNEGIIPQSIDVLFSQIGDKMLESVNFVPKMATNLCYISDDEIKSRDAIKEEVMAMANESRHSIGQRSQTSLESTELGDTIAISPADVTANVTTAESYCEMDQAKGPVKYAVFVSFVEVYRELVYDLLVPVSEEKRRSRPVLMIADDKKGTAYVKGMRQIQINTPQELLKVLSVGQKNLHVAATKLNKDSSRSHCIFTITLVQVMDIPEPHGARVSKISFCDLAGSERANKTGEAGDRLKEAGKINNSLMKLGMCISDLRHNQKYKDDKSKQKAISFRESKLTRLFRNYLLGDGRACMIVNANMCVSGFDENIHVLKFSAIAKEVQIINKPKRSEIIKNKARATISEDTVGTTVQRNPRATIAWERKLSPVKDVEEEEESEEEGSDQSDSDPDEYEQSVECDVSFWQNREKKYIELIDMLKKALLQEKKKCKDQEVRIRNQCADFMQNQIVDIEQKHNDQIEDTIDMLMDEQKTRVEIMANIANLNIKELKEGFEKKIWELTVKNTAMEKELRECKDLVNAKATELLSAEEKVTSLELQTNELKMELEKKEKELAASKRRSMRSSRYSDGSDKGSMVQDLLEKNEEGKAIIRSLVEEMEEYRAQVENTQEECEKLKEELTSAKNEHENFLKQTTADDADKVELNELRSSLEQMSEQVSVLEHTASDLVEGMEIFGQDVSLDEDKPLKFTEGILQALPEFLQKKEARITQLESDLENEVKDKTSTKERLAATTALLEEATIKMDSLASDLDGKEKDIEKIVAEKEDAEKSLTEKAELAKREMETMKQSLEQQVEELRHKLKVAEEASSELHSVKEKLESLEKEIVEKNDFEQKLMKETDRLHVEVEKLKKENLKVEQASQKRSSDASDMLRDVEILTKDRNDLLERVESLRKKLTDVTKERDGLKEELRENIANTTTVQNTTEMLEMKEVLRKKDKEVATLTSEKDELCTLRDDLKCQISSLNEKVDEIEKSRDEEKTRFLRENEECQNLVSQMKESTQKLNEEITNLHEEGKALADERDDLSKLVERQREELKTHEREFKDLESKIENSSKHRAEEKEGLLQRQSELETEIQTLRKNLQDIEQEKESNSRQRKASEEEKCDLEEELSKKKDELEKAKAAFADFKNKTTDHIEQVKKDHDVEVKGMKKTHSSEMKQLQSELSQCRKTIEGREKELANFRENRDRIVAALEVQIKNDKATNGMLKANLDEQMAENVKLKSQNAAATAELSDLKKRTEEKENKKMKKSISASAVLNIDPVVMIKKEPLSPCLEETRQTKRQSQDKMPLKDVESNVQSATSEEEPPTVEKTRTSGRTTRGRKRGSSTGSRGGSKRGKKSSYRPATPLPEVQSGEEEGPTSPVKVTRTTSRTAKRSAAARIKSEQLESEQGVLDDSELLKETGNARQFPESTLEIDVTPNLSKKASKTRKRAGRKEDQENDSEDADVGLSTTRSMRRKTRATNSNNSNSAKTSDEEQPTAPVSGAKNLTKVGSILRNSPVGHALKCIEEVISPASKSPKKAKRQPDDQNKRTRRLVKLHPDDISYPLEATPSPELTRDPATHAAVSDTPGRMIRRLRNRK